MAREEIMSKKRKSQLETKKEEKGVERTREKDLKRLKNSFGQRERSEIKVGQCSKSVRRETWEKMRRNVLAR